MGNQGMTNWKFTAFLAIALMLVAGTFSTAIAADGDGTVTVNWADDGDTTAADNKTTPQTVVDGAAAETANPLRSGSVENEVEFIYTVPVPTTGSNNMQDGALRIVIPSGFTVSKGLVTVSDAGTVIYDTIRDGTADSAADPAGPQEADNADTGDRGRVKILPVSGSNISSIEVALKGATWNVASGDTAPTLTIQFSLVTAAIPSRLPFMNSESEHYEEYQFTTYSKAKDGTFTRLKQLPDTDVNPQPHVRVGNAATGTGTVVVTPATVYEGEPDHDFRVIFTAPGPIYDGTLVVTIPEALLEPNNTDDTRPHLQEFTDAFTISQRGGVNFGDPVVYSETARTVTIDIDSMGTNDQIRVFYENITVQPFGADQADQFFTVATDTGEADTTLASVSTDKGKVSAVDGSGTITIEPSAVPIDATRDFTIRYVAATKLSNAYLVVQVPPAVGGTNALLEENGTDPLMLQAIERNAEGTAFDYGYVSASGLPSGTTQTITDGSTDADPGTTVVWGPLSLNKGASFTRTIKRAKVVGGAGAAVYNWNVRLEVTDTRPTGATGGNGTSMVALYVLETDSNPDAPNVTFSIIDASGTAVADPAYAAASKQTIMFGFTATSTPIRKGNVSFTLPSGWTPPNKTTDKDGRISISIDDVRDTDPAAVTDLKHVSISGMRVTVNVDALIETGTVWVTYTDGMVQRNAAEEVEIPSRFRAGTIVPERVSNIETVEINNVADGSGTATISPTTVDAGSTGNDMLVRFMAQGSMDGGHVRLTNASGWGNFQGTNSAGDNYVQISASSGGSLRDTAIGDTIVTAYFDEFGYGDVLTITIDNAVAQNSLGIANFLIQSAGSRSGTLRNVEGETHDKRGDQKAIDLLGKVYVSTTPDDAGTADIPEDHDGLLRVEVAGGGDGSGKATVAIVSSKAGPAQYEVTANDGTVSTRVIEQVHAGDDETHLRFVYAPIETIGDGELQFTVSPGWSAPQVDSSSMPGYTEVDSTGSIGAVTVSGGSVSVPIYSLDKDGTITIDYGTSDGGAVAPATRTGNTAFDIKTKGSATGSLVSLGSGNMEQITVRPQASGEGTAEIDTDGNVHAGDTGRAFTITYTSIAQIVGGKLKVTVPAGDDWADATDASIDVSAGTPTFGGDLSATALADNDDVGSVNDLVISNINMGADQTLTVTYMSDAPPKAGDATFAVSFNGGHGPDMDFKAVASLSVTVMEAKAGSGTVMIDQMGEVVAGSEGNDITITYTVAAQIKGTVPGQTTVDRPFRIQVPAGWSAPSAAATAEANAGTYTVEHSRMDATTGVYAVRTGEVEEQAPAKADGATADDPTVYMVARVISEKTVEQGDRITFTYENATAPAMPEKSTFRFFFDGVQVTPDLNVIVQSAEGASGLALEADDFVIEDGDATVTVKLVAADGSVATRNEATTVTLNASSGEITSPVTIDAGDYHGYATLSATASANITVTASATGLEGAEISVHADTNNVTIDSVSLSQTVAKAGDTVMVSATGSAAQEGKFSVGSVITDMALTEDQAGSYTGSFDVVADLQDGMHTVTVSLNGASDDSASITIDTVAPTVTAESSDAEVANGDEITITVTAADDGGSGVASVTANVSALDSTQGDVDVTSGSAEITISENNEADNGAHDITVTATDNAGNSASTTVSVTLNNVISFTSTLPAGISLFSVPLNEEGLDTVGDLEAKLGDNVNLLITYDGTNWNSRSSDVAIDGSVGILVSMGAETTVTFTGYAWEDTTVSLANGSNLVGLPVNDARVANISDIAGLFGEGVVTNVIASSGGEFQLIAAAGDPGDGPVAGDAAYLVMASDAGSATLTGDGWENGEAAGAAPIALSGYTVDNQTPVLDVLGSVVDELTGLEKEGFRVKVKNLSTKASLSNISTDGYNITFVDLTDSHAARVGDVLEVSADSPNPLIGITPVRHVVTVDDVKSSLIQLEDLIAYEIPAETELLRNYPNPFNPETWIPYHLSEDADVSLTIYDVNGALVRDIDVGHQTAAKYDTRSKAIYWDGRNQFGEQVASGIYFYSLSAGDFSATRKMVILK